MEIIRFFDKDYRRRPYWFEDRPKATNYFFEVFTGGMRERVFGNNPPPILSKVPLFRHTEATYLTQGMHAINGGVLSGLQGVVIHTKFLSDFIERVDEECKREQHYGKAFRYKIYQKKTKENPELQLFSPESVEFKDSKQLVDLGMMKTTPEFEAFAQLVLAEKTV